MQRCVCLNEKYLSSSAWIIELILPFWMLAYLKIDTFSYSNGVLALMCLWLRKNYVVAGQIIASSNCISAVQCLMRIVIYIHRVLSTRISILATFLSLMMVLSRLSIM